MSWCHLQVSDGALRCFASLADRFTRRGVDPAPLAKHGLTEELLSRMAAAGGTASGPSSTCKPGRTSSGATPSAADSKLSNQVSTIVSLLSTLCRGSPLVTHVRYIFTEYFSFARCHTYYVSSVFYDRSLQENPRFLGLLFRNVCCISPFRIFCAQNCLTQWRVLCRGMSAVCWTPCGWWTCCWCCSLRDARLCPNLQLVLLVVSLVCGVSTALGNAPTDSLLTVYAAKTPMPSLMPLTPVVSVQVVHARSIFWMSVDFEG